MTLSIEAEGDKFVIVRRRFAASPEAVYRAHTESDLIKQWMLGPEGWTMPVCEAPNGTGSSFRYEWESADGEQRFGFVGEVLEVDNYLMRYDSYRLEAVDDHLGAITDVALFDRRSGRELGELHAEQRMHPNMLALELREAFNAAKRMGELHKRLSGPGVSQLGLQVGVHHIGRDARFLGQCSTYTARGYADDQTTDI